MKQQLSKWNPIVKKCNKTFDLVNSVLSRDSSLVISASGCDVYLFHRSTGEVDKIFRKHDHHVLAVTINKTNPLQIISCCQKKLILWDHTDLTVIKTFDLMLEDIYEMYINPHADDLQYIFYKKRVKSDLFLFKYDLKESISEQLHKVSGEANTVTFSWNGRHVVSVHCSKLMMYDTLKSKTWHRRVPKSRHFFQCVGVDPNDPTRYVAAGDKGGRIYVWEGPFGRATDPFLLHWHYSGVNDIVFSPDGYSLLSGGNEGTLVVWHLEKQTKIFRPSINGKINQLSCSTDKRFITMTSDNNMIHVLSTIDFETESILKFLAKASDGSWGLTYNTKLNSLVLNGNPKGMLQFYRPKTDHVVMTLDVFSENAMSTRDLGYGTVVDKVVFDQTGEWMATVHIRSTRILPTDRSLCIWRHDKETFTLNTLVNPPHKQDLASIAFRPEQSEEESLLITASKNGELKSWICQQAEKKVGDSTFKDRWVLQNIWEGGKGDCQKINFSQDGSLLTVLFDEIMVFDPKTLTNVATLSWPYKDTDKLKSMCMCNNSSSNYLVALSDNNIIVWDLKTFQRKWKLETSSSLLIADPFSQYFATVIPRDDGKQSFLMFDPSSPKPVIAVANLVEGSCIKNVVFAGPQPSQLFEEWPETGEPFFLNNQSDVFCFGDLESGREDAFFQKPLEKASTFENIFRNHEKELETRNQEDSSINLPLGNPCKNAMKQMMTTPSHILPDVDVMCNAFFHSLLLAVGTNKDSEETSTTKEQEVMEIVNEDESTETNQEEPSTSTVDYNQIISNFKVKKPKVNALRDILAQG